ncbi:hypothetical protein CVD28_26585 [Bacillus sp. M6-12]|nr:hypothetical protein CVD28_26585 [Bacillus sp. M6-12]
MRGLPLFFFMDSEDFFQIREKALKKEGKKSGNMCKIKKTKWLKTGVSVNFNQTANKGMRFESGEIGKDFNRCTEDV